MSDLELLESVRQAMRDAMKKGALQALDMTTFLHLAQYVMLERIAEALEKIAAEDPMPPGRG